MTGDHGIVYKGFFKGANPPLPVAIKTLFFKNMPRALKEQSIRECSLIMVLRHPNVIGCYDAFLENGELHMILELAGGYVGTHDIFAEGIIYINPVVFLRYWS